MIRNYSNNRIYKNFKAVKIISIIAIVVASVGLTIDIFFIIFFSLEVDIIKFIAEITKCIPYHLCSLGIPQLQLSTTRKSYGQFAKKETKFHNDFSNLLTIIILSLFPLILYPLFTLLGINELLYLPNIFIYIADGFLIYNCVLIRREWKDSPPEFYKEQQSKIAQKRIEQMNNRNMEQYRTLIEKCGIKFFIKYYKPIKRLPLRDVNIEEDYSYNEREERLLAAKKIIDLGLVEFTLNEILNTYSDILDEDTVNQVKSLLEEAQ